MRKGLKRNKIAFIIPSLTSGGMERVMVEIMQYIVEQYNEKCHLILYGSTREIFYKVPTGVKLHLPNFAFNYNRRQWMTMKTMAFIRKTIKEIKPDVILSFGEYWNSLVLLSLIGIKTPVYISDRSSPELNLGFIHSKLRRILYPCAKGIIAQTQKAKEILENKTGNRNIRVIGNPIREISVPEVQNRDKIVLSVGRLIRTKHFNRLIDIFYSLNKPDWKLIIIGGDPDKEKISEELQSQIEKLQLKGQVILAGKLKNIEDFLLQSSIFAMTSSSEGFPNVIAEAMRTGIPVVAYDCVAGPSEMIVNGKNGFLIPLFDDRLFVEKLQYLAEHKDNRELMGQYARESIKKFSSEIVCEQFYRFITESI